MTMADSEDMRQLRAWFRARLDAENIRYDRETLRYEADSDYDRSFHRLLAEARQLWLGRYGYAPTPGQLTQAFFDAEFDRFRSERRKRRPLLARMKSLLGLR